MDLSRRCYYAKQLVQVVKARRCVINIAEKQVDYEAKLPNTVQR